MMGSGLGLLQTGGSDERFYEKCETAREDRNYTGADPTREKGRSSDQNSLYFITFSLRSSILPILSADFLLN